VPLNDRDYMKPSSPRGYNRGTGVLDSFFMNPVLVIMAFNVLIYLLSLFSQDLQGRIITNLGLIPAFFAQKPWTILTSMFVHVDFWHIFSNMLVLFFFGKVIYKMVGGWRFLVIYFIGGLVGNLLYLAIGPQNIAFGASGAVYAVAGTLVVLMPNMRVALWGIIPMPMWVFAIVFLGILSIPPFAGQHVAWQAHMGGLAVGLIAGLIYRRQMRHIIYR
jgi:uncharacterized protein